MERVLTLNEASRAVDDFRLGHGGFTAWDVRIELLGSTVGMIHIRVSGNVPNRDDGRELPFGGRLQLDHHVHCDMVSALNREAFDDMLHRLLKEFVLHELDESILVNGLRVFDPHKHHGPLP